MGIPSNFISKNPIQIAVAQGTSPLSVSSTTLVTNLNADMIDGVHLSGLVQTSALGVNSGVATLDNTGKLTASQVPTIGTNQKLFIQDTTPSVSSGNNALWVQIINNKITLNLIQG